MIEQGRLRPRGVHRHLRDLKNVPHEDKFKGAWWAGVITTLAQGLEENTYRYESEIRHVVSFLNNVGTTEEIFGRPRTPAEIQKAYLLLSEVLERHRGFRRSPTNQPVGAKLVRQ